MKLGIGRGSFNRDFIVFLLMWLSLKHQYEILHWDWPNKVVINSFLYQYSDV